MSLIERSRINAGIDELALLKRSVDRCRMNYQLPLKSRILTGYLAPEAQECAAQSIKAIWRGAKVLTARAADFKEPPGPSRAVQHQQLLGMPACEFETQCFQMLHAPPPMPATGRLETAQQRQIALTAATLVRPQLLGATCRTRHCVGFINQLCSIAKFCLSWHSEITRPASRK